MNLYAAGEFVRGLLYALYAGEEAGGSASIGGIKGLLTQHPLIGSSPQRQLEVLRTPRSGSAFTHRVIVTCPGNSATPHWPRAPIYPGRWRSPR
jgi:hypothetical protein